MVSLVLYLLVSWPRMIVIFLTRAALQIWTRWGSSSSSQRIRPCRSRQSSKNSRYLYLPRHVIIILTRDDPAFSFSFHSSCVMSLLLEPRGWAPKCVQCSFSSPFKIQSSVSVLSCFTSYEQVVVKMFPHQTLCSCFPSVGCAPSPFYLSHQYAPISTEFYRQSSTFRRQLLYNLHFCTL